MYGGAILARQQQVGGGVIDELFLAGVETEQRAQVQFGLRQIDAVVGQMLGRAIECVANVVLALQACNPLFGLADAHGRSEPVGNIAQVAQCARQMPFEDVGVQIFDFPRTHRRKEIGEVIAAAGEGLDLACPPYRKPRRRRSCSAPGSPRAPRRSRRRRLPCRAAWAGRELRTSTSCRRSRESRSACSACRRHLRSRGDRHS